jgi:uncharacterized protein YbjT (DUF2867 family)
MNKKAIIIGASGLIGKFCLSYLLMDKNYTEVIAVSRKALPIKDPKLKNIVCDFDNLESYAKEFVADDVFCCLGTTIKVAKTKENFKKVDLQYPIIFANITKRNGASKFLVVSAMGANKSSSIFYNQVKGEMEEQLKSIGFKGLYIFRPSLLLGMRTEFRLGESLAIMSSKLWSPILSIFAKQYKPIDAMVVAHAMYQKAIDNNFEHQTYSSDKIQEIFNNRNK